MLKLVLKLVKVVRVVKRLKRENDEIMKDVGHRKTMPLTAGKNTRIFKFHLRILNLKATTRLKTGLEVIHVQIHVITLQSLINAKFSRQRF